MTVDNFEGGIATLSADSTPDFDSSAPFEISGVAIPANTIVNGGQNVDHFFSEETLENAKDLLVGAPIVKNFHDLEGQATADEVIGKVTDTGMQKGVGLVFNGEITDKDIAEKIAHGFLDVSPSPARTLGEFDEAMGAQEVDRIVDFRDLAVVANGQPGADVNIGPNPAVEALSRDALSRGFDVLADIDEVSVGDLVRWGTSGDRDGYGRVEEIREEGDEPLDDEIDGDVTVNPPAVLIEVHTPGTDGWEATGQMVGHQVESVTVIEELPDPDTLQSDMDMTPPEQAQTNAEAVLEIQDKTDAMTDTGWARANQLADGESLSEDVIERMAQFNRHRDNSEFANFSDIPESRKSEDAENPWWEDNGTVAWLGWGGSAGVDWAIEQSEEMDSMDSDALESDMKTVAGVSFQGTRDGDLDESEIPTDDFEGHYLYPGDNKSASSYPVVDGEGFLRKGNVDSAWQLGARGDIDEDEHDRRLLELAQEFDSPPEWAVESETDTQSDDGTHGVWSPSSVAAESTKTMTELSDSEKAVLRAAEDIEDADDVLNQYAAAEQPEIVESDTLSEKDEQLDELAGVFRDALKNDKGLKEETVEAMPLDALASEFRNEEGDIEVGALSQTPETGQVDTNGSDESAKDIDSLSASEREALKAKRRKIKALEGRTPERVKQLKAEMADTLGAENYEDVEVDAL